MVLRSDDDTLAAWLQRVERKLDLLREGDPTLRLLGASEHRYRRNPPATEEAVGALESRHQIRLPAAYRRFLTDFSDGGVGPAFGLFTVADAFAAHLSPQRPFPYRSARRVSYDDRQTEEELRRLTAFYRDPTNEHGKVILAELGCGMHADLIVTGDAKGQVWVDNRTTEWGGLYPFAEYGNSQPLDFASWYEGWLDISLASLVP